MIKHKTVITKSEFFFFLNCLNYIKTVTKLKTDIYILLNLLTPN